MILMLGDKQDLHLYRLEIEFQRRNIDAVVVDPMNDWPQKVSMVNLNSRDHNQTLDAATLDNAALAVESLPLYVGEKYVLDDSIDFSHFDIDECSVFPGTRTAIRRTTNREWQEICAAKVGFRIGQSPDYATSIRAVVIGARIFAAAIRPISGVSFSKELWNRCSPSAAITPALLPVFLADGCRDLISEMDLLFATVDIAVDSDGVAYFQNVDPYGNVGCIEDRTGLPISRAIVDEMLKKQAENRLLDLSKKSAEDNSKMRFVKRIKRVKARFHS